MATLTNNEKRQIRNYLERKANEMDVPVTWLKGEVESAAQAVEDLIDSSKTAIGNAIETASPGVFSVAEKKYISALVMYHNYVKDKV